MTPPVKGTACPDGWCRFKPVRDLYAWLGEQIRECDEQADDMLIPDSVSLAAFHHAGAFTEVRQQLRGQFAWLPFEPEIDDR